MRSRHNKNTPVVKIPLYLLENLIFQEKTISLEIIGDYWYVTPKTLELSLVQKAAQPSELCEGLKIHSTACHLS